MDKVFIEEEAVMTVAFREADIPLEQPPSKRVTEYQLMWRAFRRDPLAVTSLIVIIIFVVGAVFAPWLTPYPDQGLGDPNILEKFVAPDATHPLGTDYLGRDVLARVLYGGRSSLSIGFLVVFIAVTIGVPLGAMAGYYGGWLDNLVMRITDIFLAFPPLLLAIALAENNISSKPRAVLACLAGGSSFPTCCPM
jgi:peptide/nickel transport system permease protein